MENLLPLLASWADVNGCWSLVLQNIVFWLRTDHYMIWNSEVFFSFAKFWVLLQDYPPANHTRFCSVLIVSCLDRNWIDKSFFLSFFLNYLFKLEGNYFTILWWFLPYTDMNQPWVYTCPPSWNPSPFHPSGLSQCTSFECPVSGIKLELVIYFTYGNLHVSMLFSKIISPSPSPTESKSLFFISVSLFLSWI